MTANIAAPPAGAWKQIGRRLAAQPIFLVAAAVLLLAAIGLNGATQFLRLHFKKEAVPLRAKLETIPDDLGDWTCVLKDQSLDPELVSTLDTHEFIFRWYVRTGDQGVTGTYVPRDELNRMFKPEMSYAERRKAIDALAANPLYHDVVVNLAVTYYTGKADTVAHIPERCYTAAGYEPSEFTLVHWDVHDSQGEIGVRFIDFEDQVRGSGANSMQTKRVAYFFNCNGSYTDDHFEVRARLQNLFERHGYYAKVEMMTVEPEPKLWDRSKTEKSMTDLLVYAMPEIERCLPDWASLPR